MEYRSLNKLTAFFVGSLFILTNAFAASEDIAASKKTEAPGLVNLSSLLQDAGQKNPGILAKKKEYESKKGMVIDTWLLEDPEFGVDVEGQPDLFAFDRRMNSEFMAVQTVPFPTKLLFRGLAASKEAEAAYQAYREEERQFIWRLKEPYYKLYFAKKTIELLKENQQLLEQAEKTAQTLYESGNAMQADVLKARIEISKIEIDLFNAKQEERLQEARLSSLLSQPMSTHYELNMPAERQEMSLSIEQLEEISLRQRPELRMFVLESERAGFNQALAHHEWLPDITLRYEGRQYLGEGDIREHDTFIGFSVPVWSLLKGVGGTWAAADAEAAAARERLAQARNELLLDVQGAYLALKQAEHALQAYESNILPQAKQQVEVLLAAYEGGKTVFLNVIDAQRTLRDSQIEYYRALTDYQIALAELTACCGIDLLEKV